VVAAIAITVGAVFSTRFVKHAHAISAGFDEVAEAPATPAPAPVLAKRPAVSDAKPSEDQIVAKVLDKIKAEQVTAKPPAPEPPKFVLQGVTSEGGAREAMINGVNVREGDDVDGARVVTIESRRVKLQFGEREITVRLP
jgi:hypothetical protein